MKAQWLQAVEESYVDTRNGLAGRFIFDGRPTTQVINVEVDQLPLNELPEDRHQTVIIGPVMIPEISSPIFAYVGDVVSDLPLKERRTDCYYDSLEFVVWKPSMFPESEKALEVAPYISDWTQIADSDHHTFGYGGDNLFRIEVLKIGRVVFGHIVEKTVTWRCNGIDYPIMFYLGFCKVHEQGTDLLLSANGAREIICLGLNFQEVGPQ